MWTKSSGVLLNTSQIAFLDDLAKVTDVPLHVTSGIRTAEQQVKAVCYKVSQGDNLSIYNQSYAQKFLESCPSNDDLIAYQQRLFDKASSSSHGSGMAIDFRTRNLTGTQIEQLKQAVVKIGGKALYEPVPPHLHVEIKGHTPLTSKIYKKPFFWVSIGAIAIPLTIFLIRRKK